MKRIINTIFLLLLMPLGAMSQVSKGNVTQLMAEANRFFDAGEYKQAKDKYSDVYLDYGNREAFDRVNICTECLNLLSKAMNFEREDNYTSAIDVYQSILRLNSKDPNVAKYIANCKKKQYQPMLDKAQSLYREGNYRQAQSNLNQYIFSTGVSEEDLSNSIAKCIYLLTLAEAAYNNKNYTQAENYYNQIIQINPTDANSAKAIAVIKDHRNTEISINEDRRKKILEEGYVDLGLPSKTCWKSQNESEDYFTYSEAMSLYGSALPTPNQVRELIAKCTWTWTGHGYSIRGPNGNTIYLPAMGAKYSDHSRAKIGNRGHYWTTDQSRDLRFFPSNWYQLDFHTDTSKKKTDRFSVRLVKVFD